MKHCPTCRDAVVTTRGGACVWCDTHLDQPAPPLTINVVQDGDCLDVIANRALMIRRQSASSFRITGRADAKHAEAVERGDRDLQA